ncbi:MAG: protein kinase [Planctomycetota bacterium]|nr:protein kinase [Planctomycetota bacterium]
MAGSVPDEAFARYVHQIGNATLDQIEAAKALRAEIAEKGISISLGEVLVQQGILTAAMRENVERKLQAMQQGGLQQLGQYKLLKKLGEGGMGAVYLAEDTGLGKKVALKVLLRKFAGDKEFLSRFRREAQATGKLNHVNIVGAFAVGEELGFHYYTMEYCDGETLDAILKRNQFIQWDKAVGVVMQVARGLKHAHENGIIHRDIKPLNIFICKPLRQEEGQVEGDIFADGFVAKILDLGLSKNVGDSEASFNTATGVALGTAHYMSPEQARGDKGIDGRTDIYSLGATFYHLVTGVTPFKASTAMAVMMKHLSEQLPNPQDIRKGIPDGVVHIIRRMMAKEPNDRYANCKELLNDLELVIDSMMPSSNAIDVGKSSMEIVDLSHVEISDEVIKLVSASLAQSYRFIPINFANNVLTVAVADPQNFIALDDLRFMLNCQVTAVAATEQQITAAINRYYGGQVAAARSPRPGGEKGQE